MNRKKEETEVSDILVTALTPRMEETTKRQIHSLISLAMSIMLFMVPLTADVAAQGQIYQVSKTATAVNGIPGGNVTSVGDIISYEINVNNTDEGNLTNVTVTDPMLGGILNVTDLGEESNETLYGNYTVTQADIDNNGNGTGFITNNVTVVCDQRHTPTNATATTPIANCTIVKTVTGVTGGLNGNVTAAGNVVSYRIKVENGGQVNLTNIAVTDPMLGGLLNVTDLGIGSNETIYGNYTVTQADIDNNGNGTGFIINNATVDCDQLGPKNATVTTPIKSCTIVKTVTDVIGDGNGNVTAAGDIISYEINVNNTAGMDLTNVTVTDPMLGGLLLNMSNLGMESNETVYGNYTVTQEDINNNGNGTGFIINNATVDCDQLGPKNATVTTPIERNPNYSIFKSVINPDPTGDCIINRAGDEVPYQIVVKNEGNVDLTTVAVNDSMFSLPEPTGDDNDPGVLNPGETWIYDVIYSLTPADIENGSINNNATVICDQLPEKSSNVNTPVDQNADLSIYKSFTGIDETGDHIINEVGDVISYQVAVRNNGDVDLTNITVDDSMPMVSLTKSSGDHTDPGVLNPGETWVYTGDYSVTQTDIDSVDADGIGSITNTATVSCNELSDETSSIQLPIITAVNIPIDTNPGTNTSDKVSPGADFSTSVTSGYAPLSVQFTDKSTGSPTSWSWDFGDGGKSTEQSPAYTYNTPGTYVAKLTASNANGSTSKPETINVLQVTSSGGGGSSGGGSGGSIGSANVVSSSSGSTPNASVTQTETNTPGLEQTSTPTNVQTPEPTATSTPAKQSKKTPGFEIVTGVTALLGAIYLYRRR
jgi:uncharacterized repeat protein (TIGR01451 family)